MDNLKHSEFYRDADWRRVDSYISEMLHGIEDAQHKREEMRGMAQEEEEETLSRKLVMRRLLRKLRNKPEPELEHLQLSDDEEGECPDGDFGSAKRCDKCENDVKPCKKCVKAQKAMDREKLKAKIVRAKARAQLDAGGAMCDVVTTAVAVANKKKDHATHTYLEEARHRFLNLLKSYYWEQFEAGMVSELAVEILSEATSSTQDHPERKLHDWELLVPHFQRSRLVHFLNTVTCGRVAHLLFQSLSLQYVPPHTTSYSNQRTLNLMLTLLWRCGRDVHAGICPQLAVGSDIRCYVGQ